MTKPFRPYSAAQVAAAETIFSFWSNYAPPAAAVGFVANADRETSLNPKAIGDKDTAFGLAQDHWEPRGKAILAATGIDMRVASLPNQLIGMHWELTSPASAESKEWPAILAAKTPVAAAIAICEFYERAGAANAIARSTDLATLWAGYFGVPL